VFVLGLGAVSWAWSEVGFWAHFRADDNAAGWVLTWLLYALAAATVARVLVRFPARVGASLVLAGALYGWLVEGVVAATVYLAPPFSFIWTGVAWHGLLTVVVGWWALPRALHRGGSRAVGWCALVGAVWGLWSVGWWGAPPDDGQLAAAPQLGSYVVFVAIVTGATAAGYGLMSAFSLRPDDLRSRTMTIATLVLLGVWGLLVVVLPLPWAPLVLAPLLLLAWASMRRLDTHASNEPPPEVASATPPLGFDPGVPWRQLGPFAALPATAVATYAVLAPFAPASTGSGPFYVVFVAVVGALSVAGAVALAWALWHAWRPHRAVTAR
jgi:hypothetical protein